jgi:hypothetical protein
MSLDNLETELTEDSMFRFRGRPDVSFLPHVDQRLVETTGFSFIQRAFFQLRDESVFVMVFMLNGELIDYHSVFTTFVANYGEPSSLSPREAVWENDTVRISIERPLTVRYIDLGVFNEIVQQSAEERAAEVSDRAVFLSNF